MSAAFNNGSRGRCRAVAGLRAYLSIIGIALILEQAAIAKPRVSWTAGPRCRISVTEMKSVIDRALGGLRYVTDSEKIFVHLQHERMSCEEYTRLFEKSNFYSDAKQRNAISEWHWRVYHGDSREARELEIHRLEESMTQNRTSCASCLNGQ